jgi:hypothetical protein
MSTSGGGGGWNLSSTAAPVRATGGDGRERVGAVAAIGGDVVGAGAGRRWWSGNGGGAAAPAAVTNPSSATSLDAGEDARCGYRRCAEGFFFYFSFSIFVANRFLKWRGNVS